MTQSNYYSSLDYCKAWLNTQLLPGNTLAADDQYLLRAIRLVSRRVDNTFRSRRPLFQPYNETWTVPIDGYHVNSQMNTFRFARWLLALNGTVSAGGSAIASVEAYPDSTMPPFQMLLLNDWSQGWFNLCSSSLADVLSIPGIWGFHRDYASAWVQVDALAAAINASVLTLTVADVDGADPFGMTPRISPGDLLKIDTEYLEVVSTVLTGATANTVNVRRGINGTTAAAHLISAPVYRWEVEEPIKQAVARQAALAYARRGSYTVTEIQGMSELRFPSDWLREAVAMMQEYA